MMMMMTVPLTTQYWRNSRRVAVSGDKLSPFSATKSATMVTEIGDYSRQCGQGLTRFEV